MINSINFFVINCFGYENDPNGYDLLMFGLGSLAVISILLTYYSKIPKSNSSKDELETPIYESKDILLQSNSLEANFIIVEKTTSTFVKVFVFILIALLIQVIYLVEKKLADRKLMVVIAQLVEYQFVELNVKGSNPFNNPLVIF